MRITMLETRRLSEDGFSIKRFEKGQTYDVRHTAACEAMRQGWAFNAEDEDSDTISDEDTSKIINGLKTYGFSPELIQFHKRIGLEKSELSAAEVIDLPNKALAGHFMPGMAAVRASEGL